MLCLTRGVFCDIIKGKARDKENIMKILNSQFKLLSSLEKVFFDFPAEAKEQTCGSMLKNEIYSFQLASELEFDGDDKMWLRLEIESELKDCITAYSISYVPSMRAANPVNVCDDYITTKPGMFPDPMNKMRDMKYRVSGKKAVSVWFAVEPKSKIYGTYPIIIKVYDDEDNQLTALTYTLKIIDAELPKQKLLNTCWLHGDCIAALHNVEVGTEKYWEIFEKYLEVYARFGHNMILTPLFTPPLDTGEGLYRPTNQLVDVTVTGGEYSFGFDKLNSWIDLCNKYGVEYFEMSHLFTQWGAYYAPKIMATIDGEYKRIFGWETAATSDEYTKFLNTLLPQLKAYLCQRGVYEKCYFHVSDEPQESQLGQYEKSRNMVAKHIDDSRMMDALSHYEFYQKGLVKKPVAGTPSVMTFIENNVPGLWVYYWCGAASKVANRFMAMPSYRNRILGYQLYKYNIEGFLQWGFNFWFDQFSEKVINPYIVTDGDDIFPSGDAFVVYPMDDEGDVVTSFRLYVSNESIQDLRALQMLEELTDRKTVEALLDEVVGFDTYPRCAEYILELREKINLKIEKIVKG